MFVDEREMIYIFLLPSHSGSTPSHTGMSEDIWRPGGSIDRDAEGGEDGTDVASGWSVGNDGDSSQAQSNDPFGGSTANAGGKHIIENRDA